MSPPVRMGKRATIVFKVLGIVLASLALLVGGTITVLRTSWGGERLKRVVAKRVNDHIQGHLDIERLSFEGNRVVVFNVILRDPAGDVVAHVARAEVDLALFRLVHEEVRVTNVAIDTPSLDLVTGPDGLNLSRATAPRKRSPPKPPQPRTTEEGWVVRLDRFNLQGGAVTFAAESPAKADTKLHLTDLRTVIAARYATGNGALDLTFSLQGQSVQAPTGPITLNAEAHLRGEVVHFRADGNLLGGPIRAHADLDRQRLAEAEAALIVAIPRLTLAGQQWGPIQIDGQAHPGAIPKLDLLVDVPGLELTGKGGGEGSEKGQARRFDFSARLALLDLTATGAALHALLGSELPPLGGKGTIDLSLGGPMTGGPASCNALLKGLIAKLQVGENIVTGLSVQAHMARLAAQPEDATLAVTVASFRAGATAFHGIDVTAALKQRDLTADIKLAGPQVAHLGLQARLDDDRHGLTLNRLALAFPGTEWASDAPALLRFGGDTLSLENFRLVSQEQTIALNGQKIGKAVAAHLAITKLRLERLPAWAVSPSLRLAGLLGLDVRASGAVDNPRVVAALRLQQGRIEELTKLGVRADATLADRIVDGTLAVEVPFAALDARFKLPTDLNATDPPLDVGVDITRLDIGEALRALARPERADGKVTMKLRVAGSAQSPRVEATVTGKELQVGAPPSAPVKRPQKVDLGTAHVHLSYAERLAKLGLTFAATEGGTVNVDADARVDLSYPRVTRGLAVAKLPVHGKVLAKNLDVAWIAQFSDRLQTVAGQVNADAKLAGTLADPQFVGDVRWTNGKLIATTAPPSPPR